MTRSDVGKGHPEYYQDMAERIAARDPAAFYVNQFANPANPEAHETTTGPGDLASRWSGELDAVVCGVGSRRHDHGLGRFFARVAPEVEMVLADPAGLGARADYVKTGKPRRGRLLAGRGHRRGFHPADLRPLARRRGLHHPRRGELRDRARAAATRKASSAGSSSGTLAGRGAALLPRADRAEARGHLRLRQRQQVPLEDVQRLLDDRPGLHRAASRTATCATSSPGACRTRDRHGRCPTTRCSRPTRA